MEEKVCKGCGITMRQSRKESKVNWQMRQFCTAECKASWKEREWELDLLDIRHLVWFNIIPDEIARRLGYQTASLRERLYAKGEPALAAYFTVEGRVAA